MKSQPRLILLACLALCLADARDSFGVLANAWHIPDNTSDLGFNMRNPEFWIGTNTTITVYQGVQKYNNPGYGTANQTGGTLYYKGSSQGTWSSTASGLASGRRPQPQQPVLEGLLQHLQRRHQRSHSVLPLSHLQFRRRKHLPLRRRRRQQHHRQPGHRCRLSLHHPQPPRLALPCRQPRHQPWLR